MAQLLPVVEATQERKQRDAFCEVSHRPAEAPMWKFWILVFQTRKQGVGIPPQAPQDLAKLPGQGDPSIPQCGQSLLDLPSSGGTAGAWDTCAKGTQLWYSKGGGVQCKGLEMDEKALETGLSCVLPGEIHGKLPRHLLFTCVWWVSGVGSKDWSSLKNKAQPWFTLVIVGY